MIKKIIAGVMSLAMLAGAAALLPNDTSLFGTEISAAAALDKLYTDGDWGYYIDDNGGAYLCVYNGKAADLTIPTTVGGRKVSYLGNIIFKDGTKLKNVTVKNIPMVDAAFYGLKSLESAVIENVDYSMYAFADCVNLKKLTVKGKTSFSMMDFSGCTSLETVKISCNSLGKYEFENCKKLRSIDLSGVGYIFGEYMFAGCTALTSVKLPDTMDHLPQWFFTGCTSLSSLTIPASVTEIQPTAFNGCKSMKDYYIPSTVKIIGDYSIGYYNAEMSDAAPKKYSGITIHGTKGSAAEKYAKDNGFKFAEVKDISACKATIPYSSYTYRGRGIKPSVTVKDGTKKLTKGTDYTVSYKNNESVGTATITITGKGNYTGTIKKTFKVKPLELSSSYAKVSIPYSSYTYSGSPIKPAVKVRFKDGDIISNSQYTVSYSNNVKVGTATITVKGKGTNVTGSYKKTFVVKPAKNEITSITSSKGAFRIGWKKATAGATGYQVLYSRDKTALTNAVGEVKSASAAKYVHSYSSTDLSDLSENFSKLPESGETWYVKVRSFVTKDGKASSTRYGNYSAVKSIKIK